MPFISLLFGGGFLTKIAIILLLVGFLGTGASCAFKSAELATEKHKVESLEIKTKQLETDNTILKKNVETITEVNKTTVETNNKLLAERKDTITAINNLAKQKDVDRKKLDAANKKIDEMLKDPKNNGTVAPVLRETIRDIQRKAK